MERRENGGEQRKGKRKKKRKKKKKRKEKTRDDAWGVGQLASMHGDAVEEARGRWLCRSDYYLMRMTMLFLFSMTGVISILWNNWYGCVLYGVYSNA